MDGRGHRLLGGGLGVAFGVGWFSETPWIMLLHMDLWQQLVPMILKLFVGLLSLFVALERFRAEYYQVILTQKDTILYGYKDTRSHC